MPQPGAECNRGYQLPLAPPPDELPPPKEDRLDPEELETFGIVRVSELW